MPNPMIGVRLDASTHQQLEAMATAHGVPKADIAKAAIAQYLGESHPDPIGERLTRIESALDALVNSDNRKTDNTDNRQGNNSKQMTSSTSRRGREPARLTHNGKTLTLAQWSEQLGIPVRTIHYRAKKGWPVVEVLKVTK